MMLQLAQLLVLASLAAQPPGEAPAPPTTVEAPAQPTTAEAPVRQPAGGMPPAHPSVGGMPARLPVGEAKLPKSLDLTAIRALPTQHDGRWQPLDTVARDLVHEVTGRTRFRDSDPVMVLLAWTFEPMAWMEQPVISVSNAELRKELKLPATENVFSFMGLLKDETLVKLMNEPAPMEEGRKPDPLQSKVADIRKKIEALQQIFGNQAIKVIPDPKQPNGAWKAISPVTERAPAAGDPVREAWEAVGKAFVADDAAAFSAASDKLSKALGALPAAHRPSTESIETELLYNRLRAFRIAWVVLAIGVAFAALAMLVKERAFDVVAALPLIAGLVVETYGLWLRWQIAGRIPASNMYESLLFLGWGMALFAILARFVFKQRLVLLTASGMAALALFLADVLPLDPFVRPIVPVLLDTYWMSIHVPVIMVSYSVLALGVLVAHVQLAAMAFAPRNRQLATTIDSLHYWYLHVGSILLTAGIFTGSMWAASSWGRYWGWDPKEVWSLVALLGYLTILHVRISQERTPAWAYVLAALLTAAVFGIVAWYLMPLTLTTVLALIAALGAMAFMVLARGPFATAIKSILCFWMIIMTYLGVNYVLGVGLHSYGFGTGAVVRYMFLTGGIDLVVVAGFSMLYLAMRERPVPPAVAVGAPAR